jgi:hypothetical protein
MKRRALLFLLALGTIGGYAAGLASCSAHGARRAAFERHVARVCLDAAGGGEAPATGDR